MVEHLNRERIAAMLDGPEESGPDRAHLEDCESCMHEYEQMVRVRMALSAMPELEPPAGEWDRIRQRLASSEAPSGRRSSFPTRFPVRPLWAAAVIALFVAGLGIGRQLATTSTWPPVRTAALDSPEIGTSARESNDATDAYLRTVAEMERLRGAAASNPSAWNDPSVATERLMKLDALIEASREALRTAPTDPALNDFLFDVVDERATLAGHLNRSLHSASVEY
jgi:hypothetical protein